MSVYVDPLVDYGWKYGPSCHMFADTLEELHQLASQLGMKQSWFQNDPRLPHYDLTKSKREKAIELGAIPCEFKTTARFMRKEKEMSKMRIVDLHTCKDPNVHYCGRQMPGRKGSALGNPYKVGDQDNPIEKYREWLCKQIFGNNQAVIQELKSITENSILGCWCTDLEGEAIFT
jgi:hypothetical protein